MCGWSFLTFFFVTVIALLFDSCYYDFYGYRTGVSAGHRAGEWPGSQQRLAAVCLLLEKKIRMIALKLSMGLLCWSGSS